MGQYYKPVNPKTKEWLYSHDFKWKFKRDDGQTILLRHGLKLMEHSWIGNQFVAAVERLLIPGGKWHKQPLVWAGDYAEAEKGRKNNLYGIVSKDESKKLHPKPLNSKTYIYIVNHTKKEFVDKTKVKADKDNRKIHPLPLLTCDGNGRGGGDFYGRDSKKLVGRWSRDIISIEKASPASYKEIIFNLSE